jgi:hypothetical protein
MSNACAKFVYKYSFENFECDLSLVEVKRTDLPKDAPVEQVYQWFLISTCLYNFYLFPLKFVSMYNNTRVFATHLFAFQADKGVLLNSETLKRVEMATPVEVSNNITELIVEYYQELDKKTSSIEYRGETYDNGESVIFLDPLTNIWNLGELTISDDGKNYVIQGVLLNSSIDSKTEEKSCSARFGKHAWFRMNHHAPGFEPDALRRFHVNERYSVSSHGGVFQVTSTINSNAVVLIQENKILLLQENALIDAIRCK